VGPRKRLMMKRVRKRIKKGERMVMRKATREFCLKVPKMMGLEVVAKRQKSRRIAAVIDP